MTNALQTTLMSSMHLPDAAQGADVPWIHLLPVDGAGAISSHDGRGPYYAPDLEALIAQSFAQASKLAIDENHAIDIAAPNGAPSPAVGWVVEMQVRENGIWGRVEWNEQGRKLIADKAYSGVSPVITHDPRTNEIHAILRASLVNTPNLRGMTALHNKDPKMGLIEKLRAALKLDKDADEAAIMAAIKKMGAKEAPAAVATQSQLDTLGQHLGLKGGAEMPALITAAQAMQQNAQTGDAAKDDKIAALQSSVTDMGKELHAMQVADKKSRAEAFVDARLSEGRAGLNTGVRDQYVALHMTDPSGTEALIAAMPVLGGSAPVVQGEQTALHSKEPAEIAGLAKAYQAKQAQAGVRIDIATAITAIQEGAE